MTDILDEIEDDENGVTYFRLKNGNTMMALIEEEDDDTFTLSGAMDMTIIDQGQHYGMSVQPTIPYGIDQEITLNKADILFSIVPNEILTELYLQRSEEAVEILVSYLQKLEEERKKKAKFLN